jgi:hypothetical protein
MIGPKTLCKLLPSNGGSVCRTAILIWIPPVLSCSLKLSRSKQHLLLIITLSNVVLLLHRTKPIIGFQWISGMSEHWGMTLQKFSMLITRMCSSNWLVLLIFHQSLHQLCLYCQEFMNSRWWTNSTTTVSTSSSSRHLSSNTISNLRDYHIIDNSRDRERNLITFWIYSNFSSSVNRPISSYRYPVEV